MTDQDAETLRANARQVIALGESLGMVVLVMAQTPDHMRYWISPNIEPDDMQASLRAIVADLMPRPNTRPN